MYLKILVQSLKSTDAWLLSTISFNFFRFQFGNMNMDNTKFSPLGISLSWQIISKVPFWITISTKQLTSVANYFFRNKSQLKQIEMKSICKEFACKIRLWTILTRTVKILAGLKGDCKLFQVHSWFQAVIQNWNYWITNRRRFAELMCNSGVNHIFGLHSSAQRSPSILSLF